MVWHGDDPSKKYAELDPVGAVSVYGGVRIPTGRKRRNSKSYSGFGDLDPPNTRLYNLMNNVLAIEDLDDEELSYGITKCDDGKFSIRAAYDAAQLPKGMRSKMLQELRGRTEVRLGSYVMAAVDRLGEIATRANVDDKDALKAIDMLFSRVLGKTPDRVIHSQDKPFEVVLGNIERRTRAESRRVRGLSGEELDPEPLEDIDMEDVGDGVYVPTGDAPSNHNGAPTHISRERK